MIEILCRQEERKPGRDRIQDINDKEIMERIIPIEQSVGRKKKTKWYGNSWRKAERSCSAGGKTDWAGEGQYNLKKEGSIRR